MSVSSSMRWNRRLRPLIRSTIASTSRSIPGKWCSSMKQSMWSRSSAALAMIVILDQKTLDVKILHLYHLVRRKDTRSREEPPNVRARDSHRGRQGAGGSPEQRLVPDRTAPPRTPDARPLVDRGRSPARGCWFNLRPGAPRSLNIAWGPWRLCRRGRLALAHEALAGRADQRNRFREEHAHGVAKGDRLLVGAAARLNLLQRCRGELDCRVERQRGELLALGLLHRLGLLLGELAQAAHQVLRVPAEWEAAAFHRPRLAKREFVAALDVSRELGDRIGGSL